MRGRRSTFAAVLLALAACSSPPERAASTTTTTDPGAAATTTTAPDLDPAGAGFPPGVVVLSTDAVTGQLFALDVTAGTEAEVTLFADHETFADCPRRTPEGRVLVTEADSGELVVYTPGQEPPTTPLPLTAPVASCANQGPDGTVDFVHGIGDGLGLVELPAPLDAPRARPLAVDPSTLAGSSTMDVLPDGRLLVERSSDDGLGSVGLWAVGDDGAVEPMLVQDGCYIGAARLSPDGSEVATVVGCDDGTSGLFVTSLPADLADLRPVLNGVVQWVSWTPDGTWLVLAFSGTGSPDDVTIWAMARDGSALTQLSGEPDRRQVEAIAANGGTGGATSPL